MIRARCLHRSGHQFTNSSLDLASSQRPGRKFYSAFAAATLRHELAKNPWTRTPEQWQFRRRQVQRLQPISAPRFASTAPNPPPITEVQSDYVPPPQTGPAAEGDFLPASLDEVASSISPPVYEHLGFLKEMGLDYGWGPTAFVETLLEHVHIYLGTPWWASIGITIIIIRAALLKFFLDAADSSARRKTIKHLEDPINERRKVAQAERDRNALRESWIELSTLHKSAGIVWWKSFAPFLQLPIGFGTFRLLRGMATLPVPGFDTGGLLWVYDLTVPDPYYLLPAATAFAYHYAFKHGGEAGNSDLLSHNSQQFFLYGLPLLGGGFMAWWPAGLQLTFAITAVLSAVQARLFRNAWFRNLVGIQPLPQQIAPKPQSQTYPRYHGPSQNPSSLEAQTGIIGSIKGTVSNFMKKGEEVYRQRAQKGRLSAGEKRHAVAYEDKRQRELAEGAAMKRELAQTRFEKEQEQVAKDREKAEGLRRRAEKKSRRGL